MAIRQLIRIYCQIGLVVITVAISGKLIAASFCVNSVVDLVDALPGDGQCDDGNGKCTLRAAIQEANARDGKDTIHLDQGTYILTIPGGNEDMAASGDLDITDDLIIIGKGANQTIIDGNRQWRVIEAPKGPVSKSGPIITISGVTIRRGLAEKSNLYGEHGGGISVVDGAELTISDCVITDNAAHNGGGIYVMLVSILKISNCIVSNNTAENGGGIYDATYSFIDVDNCTVNNNTATRHGGGISNGGLNNITDSSAIITNTMITDNKAQSLGGGLFQSYISDTTIVNTTINNNQADSGGGVATSFSGGELILKNSTVSSNRANVSGGGLYGAGNVETLEIINSTITNNVAAAGAGGGISNFADIIYIRNSIVAGNIAPGANSQDCSISVNSQGYNLIGTDVGCDFQASSGDLVGNSTAIINPLLAPLGDYGGPTYTHALLPDSPALSAGYPGVPGSSSIACELNDQRGVSRLQSDRCDIGAYETVADADLWVRFLDAETKMPVDEIITLNIEIGNKGPNEANNIVLDITLPEGGQNQDSVGERWTCLSSSNTISCSLDILASTGQSTLEVRFWPPGNVDSLITIASVAAATRDPVSLNNQAKFEIKEAGESEDDGATSESESSVSSTNGFDSLTSVQSSSTGPRQPGQTQGNNAIAASGWPGKWNTVGHVGEEDASTVQAIDTMVAAVPAGTIAAVKQKLDYAELMARLDESSDGATLVGAGVVFFAGVVNLYFRVLGLLGYLFSSPLLMAFDPVPVVLLSEAEWRRRRKAVKNAQDREDKAGKLGALLDDNNK